MKILSPIIALLLAASSVTGFAANMQTVDADTQQKVVDIVKQYCSLMQEFSGDVEKVDNMEKIFAMCENSNVSVFNDLVKVSTKDISDNSIPLQQYMMLVTEKFDNNIKTTYSEYKYLKTVTQPSPLEGFDATQYAFVKVKKTLNADGFKNKSNLNILINTATMKVSSCISEDYEDPQKMYLEALSLFNEKNYKKAIPLFEQVSNLSRFSGRYRAKSMLGWIYLEQGRFNDAYGALRESSAEDPLGGILLSSKILLSDDVPFSLRNYTEGAKILMNLSENRDKEVPTMHLIAASTLYDVSIGSEVPKVHLKDNVYKNIYNDLINDPNTTDAFKIRGYIIKSKIEYIKDRNYSKALESINKAIELINTSSLSKKEYENLDVRALSAKRSIYRKMGDKDGSLSVLREMMEKPHFSMLIAEGLIAGNDYKNVFKYLMKASEYGDSFATYLISLYHLPTIDDGAASVLYIHGEARRLRDFKNWSKYTNYIFTETSQTRSYDEFWKWNQKAIDLGSIDALEDRALLQVDKKSPYKNQNISEVIESACNIACVGNRNRNNKWMLVIRMAMEQEVEKIPDTATVVFEKMDIYKTMKNLDEQGNGAADYFMFLVYDDTDSIKSIEYLEKASDLHFYTAMYGYAEYLFTKSKTQEDVGKAYKIFDNLTAYPFSDAYYDLGYIEYSYYKNYKKARRYYAKGVELKDYRCAKGLALLYRDGLGVDRDLNRAKKYFRYARMLYENVSYSYGDTEDDMVKDLMRQEAEVDSLIAACGVSGVEGKYISMLNDVLDSAKSEDDRITLAQKLLADVFDSPKAVVKTIGTNDQTVVSVETAEDFMLRLATMATDKYIVVHSSKVGKSNKIAELTIKMK